MGKTPKAAILGASTAIVALLLGCSADFHTVGRTTSIPSLGEDTGKAIHLDAQQRVVLSTAQGYCAEPSPDALSAYAASLGLKIATPSNAEASIAETLHNMTGSIGLRTQSITLMRDGLYRMCEAANNNKLEKWEVAAFLRRSQDLTAVVLAIEQLTGAVAARQVVLAPNPVASVSADLLSQQQVLDQAEKRVRATQERVNKASRRLTEIRQAAQSDESGADESTDSSDVKEAEDNLKFARLQLNDATAVRDSIKKSHKTTMTRMEAKSVESGYSVSPIAPEPLSAEATRAIAQAVETMVGAVLDKRYIDEVCMSYLTTVASSVSDATSKLRELSAVEVSRLCREYIRKTVETHETRPETQSDIEPGPPSGEELDEPLE